MLRDVNSVIWSKNAIGLCRVSTYKPFPGPRIFLGFEGSQIHLNLDHWLHLQVANALGIISCEWLSDEFQPISTRKVADVLGTVPQMANESGSLRVDLAAMHPRGGGAGQLGRAAASKAFKRAAG